MYPLPNRAELLVPDARQAERETATRASMPPTPGVMGRSLQCDATARRGRRRRVRRPVCTAVPRRTVLGGPVRARVRRHDPTCHRCRTRTGRLPRDGPARGPRSRAVRRVGRRRHPDPPGVNESETPYGLVMFRTSERVPVSLLVLTVRLALTVGGEFLLAYSARKLTPCTVLVVCTFALSGRHTARVGVGRRTTFQQYVRYLDRILICVLT